MDFLEFLASAIDSLAWPILVGSLIYILRKPVGKLLDRVSRFKYKDLEAEFRETLEDIRPADEEIIEPEPVDTTNPETVSLSELAEVSPRAAIMEAWIKIEKATENYLVSSGLEKKYSYQGLRRLPSNIRSPIEHILTQYQELRLLRNKAAHASDFDLDSSSAREFIRISGYVVREIEGAARDLA
ncbi:hypothetical protein [uncultured Neptuniibacter sp.]|uniref:hypothetical protein n=1 Tax=uncultured Neptuniibacter sp. TaxID=502143 RepID=UPI0026107D52|nr:hypothetical protein [uncultured Neptuniibacter sp.]